MSIAEKPHVYAVLGPHRTGTSALTRLLQMLGAYLGPEEAMIEPSEGDNEKGFYEASLVNVNEDLLRKIGGSWREPPVLEPGWEADDELRYISEHSRRLIASEFGDRPLWAFKDPRLSLTLPFWRQFIEPSGYIVCYRNPLDAARSLERRNALGLAQGVSLWVRYLASAIAQTAGAPRLFVAYEQLFADPHAVISALTRFVGGRDEQAHATDANLDAELETWIEPRLRHHSSSLAETLGHPAVSPEASALYLLLEHMRDVPDAQEALEALAERLVAEQTASAAPVTRLRARTGPRRLQIVAMLQVYNERRFIAPCIEHLREQGVDVYLIDNESTDETVEIAERYLGEGVLAIETVPRSEDVFALRAQCARQEQLARELSADWLIHYDADEIRTTRRLGRTLADEIAVLDAAGFNAVNFYEFTFVPTRQSPDHDHARFMETMRWYYPFAPFFPFRCNAWKQQDGPVDLATHAGHRVVFDGLKMAPESLNLRHYLFISREHALEKFVNRRFAADEVADGWFGWRARLAPEMIQLPSVSQLRYFVADHLLDPSEPLTRHLIEEFVPAMQ